MKKAAKIWLITAGIFVLIGGSVFVGVMSMIKWDFSKLSTVKYETNNNEISAEFDSISIKTNTAGVIFEVSNNEKCRVECYEDENAKHSVFAQNGTLYIERPNAKHWNELIGINNGLEKITVYLPKSEYSSLTVKGKSGDIKLPSKLTFNKADISLSTGDVDTLANVLGEIEIKTTTGNICAKNFSAGALKLSTSTGKATVSGVTCRGDITVDVSTGNAYLTDNTCKDLISSGSTGNLSLSNVTAKNFSISRSTGNVEFDRCDADEIFAKTSTGNVRGSLLTGKTFVAKSSIGNVDVPNTTTGGRCEIKTSTGNIEIRIA